MKFARFMVIATILLGGLGIGAYYFGTSFASDQIANTVSAEIDNDQNLHEIKRVVNNNSEIKKFINEGANVDEKDLPFTSIEEASKIIVKKVGLFELQNMYESYENGITPHEMEGLLKELEGTFTEDEMLALKTIAYRELNKNE